MKKLTDNIFQKTLFNFQFILCLLTLFASYDAVAFSLNGALPEKKDFICEFSAETYVSLHENGVAQTNGIYLNKKLGMPQKLKLYREGMKWRVVRRGEIREAFDVSHLRGKDLYNFIWKNEWLTIYGKLPDFYTRNRSAAEIGNRVEYAAILTQHMFGVAGPRTWQYYGLCRHAKAVEPAGKYEKQNNIVSQQALVCQCFFGISLMLLEDMEAANQLDERNPKISPLMKENYSAAYTIFRVLHINRASGVMGSTISEDQHRAKVREMIAKIYDKGYRKRKGYVDLAYRCSTWMKEIRLLIDTKFKNKFISAIWAVNEMPVPRNMNNLDEEIFKSAAQIHKK